MKYRTHWRPPLLQSLPKSLRAWLTDTGSLTRLLQQACEHAFSVNVIDTHWERALPDEALLMHKPFSQRMLQREVHLMDGDIPQIYARTLVPISTYQSMPARFDGLGNRSLGEMLFTNPSLQRGPIEVACLQPEDALYELAIHHITQRPSSLWARRSCFYLNSMPLLVTELFLPSDKWSHE